MSGLWGSGNGGTNIRELNRAYDWTLPDDGPKTLNGLILEYMETIPAPDTSLRLFGYPMEIMQSGGNGVKTVLVDPRLERKPPEQVELF